MTVNYTTLLGLAKPVTGTESGTWGDTVNNNLTDYLDAAVAGTQIISGSLTAVTLSKTTGASLSQAGSGATGSSQYQIIRCTGNPASLLTITAPAADKTYIIINATSTSQSVKIVGVGPTTGVTITAGSQALVVWNGSDFVNITPAVSGFLPTTGGTMTGAIVFTNNQMFLKWVIKTTTYTAVAGDNILADTTSAAFTITLPASASVNDTVSVADYKGTFATNNLTINSNALNLMGSVQTLILNVNYRNVTLVYSGTTQGWVIVL